MRSPENPPHPLADRRRAARSLLLAAILAMVLAVGGVSIAQDEAEDQGVVANVLSRLLTTPTTRISIGGVEGVLSTSAVIRDIAIADPQGVWLTLDRAEINWSFTALLRGRLQVSELTLDELVITRRPLPTDQPEAVEEGPVFPELPVELIVENFNLARLVLEEPVLGTAAELSATGSAQLVSPAEGLQLDFNAERMDAPGTFALAMRYVPDTNVLTLNAVHDEPAGGIVARLLELPNLPPVQLRVTGDAPLDAFVADLDFQAGPTIGAQGVATVNRAIDAYRLDLDVAAQLAGLMPETLAPVFAETTQLVGEAAFADDGSIQLERLRLDSPLAVMELTGTIDPERALALRLTGTAVPGPDGVTRVGEAELAELDLDLAVDGALASPTISGQVVAVGLRIPEGSTERLTAELSITPEPTMASPLAEIPEVAPDAPEIVPDDPIADRFRFEVSADATGVVPTDPGLAAALGDRVNLVARGITDVIGLAEIEIARIETPTMNASYEGLIARRTIDGVAEAQIPSLAPFSAVIGLDLEGAAQLTARMTGDPLIDDIRADLDGRISDFATGQTAIDGLFGPQVELSGAVASMRDGFGLEALQLNGANLELTADGAATQENADLTLDGVIPNLDALHERIDAGRALFNARLTGSLERPDATATATLHDVQAMGRSIPNFSVNLEAQDITGALDASLTLDGEVGGNPATGGFRLREVDQGHALDPLDIRIGSASVMGSLLVGPEFVTAGDLRIEVGDLDDLSPLLLMELAGQFALGVSLSVREGAQDGVIEAQGAQVRVEDILVENFRIDATGRDLLEQPQIDGIAEAERVGFAGQTFTNVRLSGEGTAEATNFSLSAIGDGAIFEADGRLMPPPPGDTMPRLDLENISLRPVEQ